MEIEHRKTKVGDTFVDEFNINDQWLTYRAISTHSKYNKIPVITLFNRWKAGKRTIEKFLFKPRKKKGEIEHKYTFLVNGKECLVLLWEGEFRSIPQISRLKSTKELKITINMLYNRWNTGDRTTETFFRARRATQNSRPESFVASGLNEIIFLGIHKDQEPGEILITFVAGDLIVKPLFWKSTRIGENKQVGRYDGNKFFDGKYPLFVLESEIIGKGWKIIYPRKK